MNFQKLLSIFKKPQPVGSDEPDYQDIFKRIDTILINQLGLEEREVQPNSCLEDDLGADELDMCELELALEDEFDVDIHGQISPYQYDGNTSLPHFTVHDIVTIVQRALV